MYKFYTIPSEDIIDKLIGQDASIKLSSAFNLNDPFELKFILDIDPKAKGHERQYYLNHPGATKEDFERWQKHALEHSGYTWYAEIQQRDAIAQLIALCSFTEDNKNTLMWSHYTNNHKGICVEYKPELFEYLKTLKGHLAFWKIKYSNKPPTVKGLENVHKKAQKIMFNKQSEWKYEKEHRVIFLSDKNTEFIPIDKNFIKAVYIGSRVETEIENKILSICTNTEIEIYHGITLGNSYEVNFRKHKDGTFYPTSFWK